MGPWPRAAVRRNDEHTFVYPTQAANLVVRLYEMGLSKKGIERVSGISIRTVGRWLRPATRTRSKLGESRRISTPAELLPKAVHPIYAYVLGLYLGDGYLSRQPGGVFQLRIFMDSRYPGMVGEAKRALRAIMPASKAGAYRRRPDNLIVVVSSSKAWPVLIPQHGPGRKHNRRIELAPWQATITQAFPRELVRGLIHSDGCRFIATQRSNGRVYAYPRYCFKNRSRDIMQIFCDHLDLLEIEWTVSLEQAQIARQGSVSLLDGFVGSKY